MSRVEILGSYGKVSSSVNYLSYAEGFNSQVAAALRNEQTALDFVRTRRDYRIPVLNRGDSALITLLTTHLDGLQPLLTVGCDYYGVKLKLAPAVELFWGEPRDQSALIGLGIAFLLCWPVVQLVPSKIAAVLTGALLGAICLVFGVIARKFSRWLVRLGS